MAETPMTDAVLNEQVEHDDITFLHIVNLSKQLEIELSKAADRLDELERQLVKAQRQARAFYALSEERMGIIEATRSQLATARQDEREECAREVKGYFMCINGTEYHADDRLRALEGQT